MHIANVEISHITTSGFVKLLGCICVRLDKTD